ncbi:hypothetical protein ACROYT_G033183 [Oculina patagonica]
MVKLLTQYIFYGRPALFAVLAIFQAYGLTNFLVKYKDYEVDMLGLVLQESEISHGIPTSFEKAIVAFACIGFLLSPLDLFGHKVQQDGLVRGSNTAVSMRIVVQVFINALFLGVRVAVHIEYGADASIFITKNVIMILIPIFKTISFLKCCEKDPEDELEI